MTRLPIWQVTDCEGFDALVLEGARGALRAHKVDATSCSSRVYSRLVT